MSTLTLGAERGEDTRPDRALLSALATGDWDAFEILYRRYIRDVYLYVLAIVTETGAAEETSQDVWSTLWAARSRLVIHGDSLLPWLLVTSRHLALKQVRSRSRRTARQAPLTPDEHSPAESPETVAEFRELQRFLADRIASLGETDQRVYALCIVDELDYDSAATRLGLTTGAVRGRLHRIRRSLRTALTESRES